MIAAVLFDWGDTVMRVLPYTGPMANWPEVAAMPDALAVLTALRKRYRLALATNADDSDERLIVRALERVGLDKAFDKVYSPASVMTFKPLPEFFLRVVADLGVRPREAVMVGDSYDGDVRGANAAGLLSVWFNPLGRGVPRRACHDLEIASLAELPAALARIELAKYEQDI